MIMNAMNKIKRPEPESPTFEEAGHVPDPGIARRTMLDIKRIILKKLAVRINKEHCLCH